MESIEKQFGKRIKELRKAKGLSQEEVAFRARIHRNYWGAVERAERNPCLKNIAAIANALDISLPELFTFDKPEPPRKTSQ